MRHQWTLQLLGQSVAAFCLMIWVVAVASDTVVRLLERAGRIDAGSLCHVQHGDWLMCFTAQTRSPEA